MSRMFLSNVRGQLPFATQLVPKSINRGIIRANSSRIRVAGDDEATLLGYGPIGGEEPEDVEWEPLVAEPVAESNGLEWVWQAGERLEKEVAMEANEDKLVEKAGLNKGTHIQGKSVVTDVVFIDEDDRRRHVWHRKLHLCAEQGDFTGAEDVLAKMRAQMHAPGPKAYHALIISYVKGGNPRGALLAIRNAWTKKIQPLPQSYAAVVHAFLQKGDIETAVAVYAANRRTPVSSEKSWTALTTALFSTGRDNDRAVALLDLGIHEDLQPDKRLYEAMIKYYCRDADLERALDALVQMKKRGWLPDKDHFSSLVTAHALAGKAEVAEKLLHEMLGCTGTSTAPTIGAINAMMRMYLKEQLPPSELAEKIAELRQLMVRSGITFDRKGYSLLLESSVYLEDPQIGLMALQSLRTQGLGSSQYVSDDTLGTFLLQLSSSGHVVGVCQALSIISYERRPLTKESMPLDSMGRSFLTAWMASPTEGEEIDPEENDELAEDTAEVDWLEIDGIQLDPVTLCAVAADGTPLPVTKMGVKELRAELAVRQSPLRGNKRELVRQLQKARAEADVVGATLGNGKDTSKKVEVILVEESWDVGNLVHQNMYEDERLLEDFDEDEDESAITTIDEVEEEEDEESVPLDDDDDDFDLDYEDRVSSMMKAQGRFNVEFQSSGWAEPGIRQALALCQGAMAMNALPSEADLVALCKAAKSVKDPQVHEGLQTLLAQEKLADRITPVVASLCAQL